MTTKTKMPASEEDKKDKKNKKDLNFVKSFFLPQNEREEIEAKAYMLMEEFLVEIENAMEARNWTQKKLAKKIGVSANYISELFHSQVLLDFKTIGKIEHALEIKFSVRATPTKKQAHPAPSTPSIAGADNK